MGTAYSFDLSPVRCRLCLCGIACLDSCVSAGVKKNADPSFVTIDSLQAKRKGWKPKSNYRNRGASRTAGSFTVLHLTGPVLLVACGRAFPSLQHNKPRRTQVDMMDGGVHNLALDAFTTLCNSPCHPGRRTTRRRPSRTSPTPPLSGALDLRLGLPTAPTDT
jgi:hypothetical protein